MLYRRYIFILLFFPTFLNCFVILSEEASLEAKDLTLYSHYDYAKRTIHDDDDEIINNTSYISRNYNLRFEHELTEQFTYQITTHQEDKDYTDPAHDAEDKKTKRIEAKLGYLSKNKHHNINLKTHYKTRRTKDSPNEEYDNVRIFLDYRYEQSKNYRVKTELSVNDYNYLKADTKDELKTGGELEFLKYFNDEDLDIGINYKIDKADKNIANRYQTKNEYKLWVNNNFKIKYIKNLKAYYKYYERDTKDEDVLDIDSDYKASEYNLTTKHDLTEKLDTAISLEYMKKDYLELDNNYTRKSIKNKFGYDLFKTKEIRTWFSLETEYKKIDYDDKTDNSYTKKHIRLESNHTRKKDYKIYCYLEKNFYDYVDNQKNKDVDRLTLGIEKRLNSPSLEGVARVSGRGSKKSHEITLELSYNYTMTDYSERADNTRHAIRFSVEWKV